MDPHSGGIAKVTTLIKQVRASNPKALLLGIGDTTHGSAETTMSVGDAFSGAGAPSSVTKQVVRSLICDGSHWVTGAPAGVPDSFDE